jgi:hypothetical protein
MKIPRKLRVGRNWYSVDVVDSMRSKGTMGLINYAARRIEIGRKCTLTGVSYKREVLHDTFWHELVHAILEDMGQDGLNRNEKFVTGFANRLTKAVDTASF